MLRRGLTNHWGYNSLGFFAPHAAYASARDPQGVLDEFKGMVKLLHRAGIEVILDVVYNHTSEQSVIGMTLSWRGLDNRAYYRLDDRGHDIDVTGCGNTLDLRHPVVCRMVLDSLRYWARTATSTASGSTSAWRSRGDGTTTTTRTTRSSSRCGPTPSCPG